MTEAQPGRTGTFRRSLRVSWTPCIAVALALLGTLSVQSAALALWDLWNTDPLKSIGGLVPLVSLILVLRAWRSIGWERNGSLWGLGLLSVAILLARVREHAVLELVLTRSWTVSLLPPALIAVGYAAGCVLLFGGWRLLRAARFPVCLMVLVNPVPHAFVRRIDLPLQHASAHVARSFAHMAGARLTSDQLRLMFTPEFGMFIAPGCNGMRGAITMGVLALVAGHVYGLRRRPWVATVLGGLTLGYVFNFVRLIGLVLYYLLALHVPGLQTRAEGADYLLGAALFFCAAALLFSVVQRSELRRATRPLPQRNKAEATPSVQTGHSEAFAWRCVLFLAVVGGAAVPYALALTRGDGSRGDSAKNTAQNSTPAFPTQAGRFHLRRTWDETLTNGALLYHWAEYASDERGPVIAAGVSPTLGAHDTLLCHVARGEDWLWHGDLRLATGSVGSTNFSASFYNDGATQMLEATTLCSEEGCGQYTVGPRERGLIYSRIALGPTLFADPVRPVPVMLRAETTDVLLAPQKAREELAAELRSFVADVDPVLLGRSAR